MKPSHAIPGSDDILRQPLANQVVFLGRGNDQSPSVVISGYLPGGSILDPADRSGLGVYLSMALMRGTKKHSFQQIYDQLESAGASLGFSSGIHSFGFSGRALAEDLPMLLGLLVEILRFPDFPQTHLDQIRDQLLTSLSIRAQDTEEMADIAFDQALFNNHPYGRDDLGSVESISAITQADLIAHHQRCFKPQGLTLAIVGGVDPARAADLVQQHFSDWSPDTAAAQRSPEFPKTTPAASPIRKHIEIAEKSQLNLVIGSTGPERKSAEFLPAVLGNCILGEFGMMGRIGNVVRDENGLAYYAGSELTSLQLGGSWTVSAGINPENFEKTTDLIHAEISRFSSQPVEAEELSDVKAYFQGRMPLQLESNAGIAGQLLTIERYDLGLDYLRNYRDQIEKVTREEILAAASAYLKPDALVTASAGTLEPAA